MTDPHPAAAVNVVSLRGEFIPQPGVCDPETVAMLRDLLKEAEAGELAGFAGVATYHDKRTALRYEGFICRATYGAVVGLLHRLVTHG